MFYYIFFDVYLQEAPYANVKVKLDTSGGLRNDDPILDEAKFYLKPAPVDHLYKEQFESLDPHVVWIGEHPRKFDFLFIRANYILLIL